MSGAKVSTMPDSDPEARLERAADELEHRLGRLDEHLDEAHKKGAERRAQDTGADEVAGDWKEMHDESGGDDPSGAGQRKDDDAEG